MAHFAELDQNNVVKRVIVVDNKDTSDANGVEKEYIGAAFCERLLGGRWVQTSYNGNFRKRFAGIGMVYLDLYDIFVDPPENGMMAGMQYNPESEQWFVPGFVEDDLQVENVGQNND
jgi:hypothetical protein